MSCSSDYFKDAAASAGVSRVSARAAGTAECTSSEFSREDTAVLSSERTSLTCVDFLASGTATAPGNGINLNTSIAISSSPLGSLLSCTSSSNALRAASLALCVSASRTRSIARQSLSCPPSLASPYHISLLPSAPPTQARVPTLFFLAGLGSRACRS